MTKLAFNYELKKVGRLFKIYEVKTKTYVAQGRNRKLVASICSRMNRGGFFDGETPGFFNLNGPIEINEKVHSRKSTQNKIKQKARIKRTRNNNKRRKKEHVLPFSGNTWS